MRVFLSYRRGDAGAYAGRLSDSLRERLGAKSVFQDVTAIAPGQDYVAVIDRALGDSDAVLAVIGTGWLTASTPEGARRLSDPDDYVRLELGRALRQSVRVVPVLVGGATVPAAPDLPDELQGLVNRQAVVLHDETWHQDVDGLVRSLRGESAVPARRRRPLLVGGVIAAVVAVGLAGAAWRWGPGGGGQASDSSSSTDEIASCAPPKGQGWQPITVLKDQTGVTKTDSGPLVFRVKDAYWRPHGETWQVELDTTMENASRDDVVHGEWRYKSLVVAQREFPWTCYSPSPNLVAPSTVGDALIGFDVRCKPVGYMELIMEFDRISVTDETLEPGTC